MMGDDQAGWNGFDLRDTLFYMMPSDGSSRQGSFITDSQRSGTFIDTENANLNFESEVRFKKSDRDTFNESFSLGTMAGHHEN